MRKVSIGRWSTSKFVNPFQGGLFIYDGKVYDCKDSHLQTLLYLYMYGINTSRKICALFSIEINSVVVELPWRRLSKIVYRIHQTEGWVHQDEYTTMMDTLYRDALKDNMVLPYDDKFTFNRGTKTIWDSWIKTWIFTNYPNIMKELSNKYKKIKIFQF